MPSGRLSEFQHLGFFVLRTPFFPYEELERWSANCTRADYVSEEGLAADRAILSARLRALAEREDIQDAIWVASPDLFESLRHWFEQPDTERGRKTERAFARYFQRTCARPTPFGLFAGCSTGKISERTNLELGSKRDYHRSTRLDMNYVSFLCNHLLRDPALRDLLRYKPNTSLYRMGGRLRYIETRQEKKVRSHHLMAAEETETIAQLLDSAAEGATRKTLIHQLTITGIPFEDASEFIEELIQSQILTPDFGFPLTGLDPLDSLIEATVQTGALSETIAKLKEVSCSLKSLDSKGVGAKPQSYQAIRLMLNHLTASSDVKPDYQVDLIKPSPQLSISDKLVSEIQQAAELFLHFVRQQEETLVAFREAFLRRYDRREISLTEALDEETGIGFPPSEPGDLHAPLLNGIVVGNPSQKEASWSKLDAFLLQQLQKAWSAHEQVIHLDPKEIELVSKDVQLRGLPDTWALVGTIAAQSESDVNEGRYSLFLHGMDAPGARLLGRFCCADTDLRKSVEQYLRVEESLHPEICFAEIIHLPEDRLGNILFRPPLREFEIPFLGTSGVSPEKQIPVTDLFISVVGDEIILRSHHLNKRVMPRLTSAHNFHFKSLGIYRFLCTLQIAGFLPPGWSWGPLSESDFLPRVVCGRTILSLARWRLNKKELESLSKQRGLSLFRAIAELREKRALPRRVSLSDMDNTLTVDLENILSIEAFVQVVKNRDAAILTEIFPPIDQLIVHDPEGSYLHEFIIPFVRKPRPASTDTREIPHSREVHAPIVRSFPPGSEWIYVKLYTGASNCDQILRNVIPRLVDRLKAARVIDRWFFIRYGDPDWHLRIRFHASRKNSVAAIFGAVQKEIVDLAENSAVWRVEFDTYEREVERYGGEQGMELAEKYFQIDSECVVKILQLTEKIENFDPNLLWRLGIYGIDLLLSDFGFALDRKATVATQIREQFGKEFRVASNPNFKSQIAEKYRKERNDLNGILEHSETLQKSSFLARGIRLLKTRSRHFKPIMKRLKLLEAKGALSENLESLAQSYVHMFLNRLFPGNQREQEFVLYDFLTELYRSQEARKKQ